MTWFGGGMDLTPYYGFEEDATHFHTRGARRALAPFGDDKYPRFKALVRRVLLPEASRTKPRGIGGIFFDDFAEGGFANGFALMQAVGDAFIDGVRADRAAPLARCPTASASATSRQYRRGRYVEFNLVFDRGTLFGLQSGGRIESILMSMPPTVKWRYDWRPEAGTPEARLYSDFLPPARMGSTNSADEQAGDKQARRTGAER